MIIYWYSIAWLYAICLCKTSQRLRLCHYVSVGFLFRLLELFQLAHYFFQCGIGVFSGIDLCHEYLIRQFRKPISLQGLLDHIDIMPPVHEIDLSIEM